MNKKILPRLFFSCLVCILLYACYPNVDISLEETDLVITNRETKVDFSQFSTYAIPDSIVKIIDGEAVDDPSVEFDKLVLETVKSNLKDIGYVESVNPSFD